MISSIKNHSFYGRPLVLAAVGFVLGILLGKFILGAPAYIVAVLLLFCGFAAMLLHKRKLALPLIAASLGLLRLLTAYPALPSPAPDCQLLGQVCSQPEETGYYYRFELKNATCDGEPIEGRVLMLLPKAEAPTLEYGSFVETTASISLPEGKLNEGGFDMRFYYFTKGITCVARADGATFLSEPGAPGFYGSILQLRARLSALLIKMMGEKNGALAANMLYGDGELVSGEILADFRASGIAHLLAVSGLHVSLLVGAWMLLLKRARPGTQLCVITAFLALYCVFTAFSASTIRASVMAICLLLGNALGRKNDTLSALGLACLLILSVSPFSLFSAGFQLSFCAVIGIALIEPILKKRLYRLPNELNSAISVSLAAQLGTLPVTAMHFNRLPLLSLPANLLAVPLAAFVVLPAGLSLLICPLSPPLAAFVAGVADVALHLIRAVAAFAAGAGMWSIPSPNLAAVLLFLLLMAVISPFFFGRHKRLFSLTCAAACLLCWALPFWLAPQAHITVLDVSGYGYVAHVHTPNEDIILGTPYELSSSDVQAYIDYRALKDFKTLETPKEGASLTLNGIPVEIMPGKIAVGGVEYSQSGQLRVSLWRGEARVKAYANEKRYDILIE